MERFYQQQEAGREALNAQAAARAAEQEKEQRRLAAGELPK
jgi:hypothetical protein